MRPCDIRASVSITPRSVAPSRFAVGSSSSSSEASRTSARAKARRWRSPAESPAPRSPIAAWTPRGRACTTSSRPAASSAATTLRFGGVGATGPDVLEDRAAKQEGLLGHPRELLAPRREIEVLERDAPHQHGPAARRDEAQQDREDSRLAAPARAGQRKNLAGADRQRQVPHGRHGTAGVRDAHALERDRRAWRPGSARAIGPPLDARAAPGASITSNARSAAATPPALAW